MRVPLKAVLRELNRRGNIHFDQWYDRKGTPISIDDNKEIGKVLVDFKNWCEKLLAECMSGSYSKIIGRNTVEMKKKDPELASFMMDAKREIANTIIKYEKAISRFYPTHK